MATQRTTVKLVIDCIQTPDSTDDVSGGDRSPFPSIDQLLPDGTGGSQADRWWGRNATSIANGAQDDWDLQALSGGPGGATVSFTEIRLLAMRAIDEDLTISVGPAGTPWTALGAAWTEIVKQGTTKLIYCPRDGELPVSAGDKIMRIDNSSGSVATYDLLIVGTSA